MCIFIPGSHSAFTKTIDVKFGSSDQVEDSDLDPRGFLRLLCFLKTSSFPGRLQVSVGLKQINVTVILVKYVHMRYTASDRAAVGPDTSVHVYTCL